MVSREVHHPVPRLVEKIRNARVPSTKRELLRFLGLVNFYREHVPRFAEVAEPLYHLTRDSSEWDWNTAAGNAFEILKARLVDTPIVLAFPDWSSEFVLQVDASSVAVGGILSQEGDAGSKLRPIAYFSSGLTPAQKNYSAGEIECWALIASSRKFRKYLQAAPSIRFVSDHNPLVWLRQQKYPRGKFARWIQELEMFNYKIEYVKGVENASADYLSRMDSIIDWEVNDDHEFFERHIYWSHPEPEIREKMKYDQKDEVVSDAIKQLKESNGVSRGQFKNQLGMNLRDGLLCRGRKSLCQLV